LRARVKHELTAKKRRNIVDGQYIIFRQRGFSAFFVLAHNKSVVVTVFNGLTQRKDTFIFVS